VPEQGFRAGTKQCLTHIDTGGIPTYKIAVTGQKTPVEIFIVGFKIKSKSIEKGRAMKKLYLACFCLIILGCASATQKKPVTTKKVIMSASDYSKGNKIAPKLTAKHWKSLENISQGVSKKYDPKKMKFGSIRILPGGNKTGGIMFGRRIVLDKSSKRPRAKNEKWLALTLVCGDGFDTLDTIFDARAATVFKRYGSSVISIVSNEKKLLNDKRVPGVIMLFKWTVEDDLIEAIIITSPKANYKKLANGRISPQSFLDKSTVLGWQGKAFSGKLNIDLKKALKTES